MTLCWLCFVIFLIRLVRILRFRLTHISALLIKFIIFIFLKIRIARLSSPVLLPLLIVLFHSFMHRQNIRLKVALAEFGQTQIMILLSIYSETQQQVIECQVGDVEQEYLNHRRKHTLPVII